MTERIRRRSNQSWPEHVLSCLTQVSQPNWHRVRLLTQNSREPKSTTLSTMSLVNQNSNCSLQCFLSNLTPRMFFFVVCILSEGRCEYSKGKSTFLNTYDQNPERSWIRQKEMGKGTKTCKNQGNSVYCQVFCVVAFIDPVLNKII